MNLRYKIGAVVAILGGMFLWGRCSKLSRPPKPSVALPANDAEQIRVDPSSHKLVISRPGKPDQTLTLPDRTSVIDIHKDDSVSVTSPQMGLEHHLFVGALLSDHVRLGVGGDFWYFKRLDIGVGVAGQMGSYAPIAFAKVTYNIKGNVQLGLVYGSNKYVGGILAVRLF